MSSVSRLVSLWSRTYHSVHLQTVVSRTLRHSSVRLSSGHTPLVSDTKQTPIQNENPTGSESTKSSRKINFDKLKHDPNWTESFGSLADDSPEFKDIELEEKRFLDDEGEDDTFEEPYRRLSKVGRRHTPNWYGRQIEKLAKQGKIYECIDMLEVKMLKEDRVMPNEYVFTVLIGALGRVGYTKKAFKLFKKMTEYGLKPEDPTYTALFNSCANCPYPEYGLQKARILREKMAEKSHQPNSIIYKAMIKAFGRCGDIVTAFGIVDEMIEAHLRIDNEVFSMLLQACISDKEAGFRHAIQVWHRINKLKRKKKVVPEIFQYNLFLRAVRDCGVGDPLLFTQLVAAGVENLLSGTPQTERLADKSGQDTGQLESGGVTTSIDDKLRSRVDMLEIKPLEDVDESVESVRGDIPEVTVAQSWWSYDPDQPSTRSLSKKSQQQIDVPSVTGSEESLAPFKVAKGITHFDTPEERLSLLGGFRQVLTSMEQDGVQPDIRTFTQLLYMIPSKLSAEEDLLAAMKNYNIKPDVDFFNILIRKRNLRHDYKHAKEVMILIIKNNLKPNNLTFGCLALGCPNKEDGLQLITDMQEAGLNISVEICNALLSQSRMNFIYKLHVLQTMQDLDIAPNEITIRTIEKYVQIGRDTIVAQEKGLPVKWKLSANFAKEYGLFMKYYKTWLLSVGLEKEPYPWEQFQKPTPETSDEVSQ